MNQYLIIKELGRGAHGSVKLVFDTEEQLVHAMKVRHALQAVLTQQGVVQEPDLCCVSDHYLLRSWLEGTASGCQSTCMRHACAGC